MNENNLYHVIKIVIRNDIINFNFQVIKLTYP